MKPDIAKAPVSASARKWPSRSSSATAASVPASVVPRRASTGRLSCSCVSTSVSASSPSTTMQPKIQRHPASATTRLPASGARIGETLNTSISIAPSRAASTPVCRSRTTARGMTMPAQAPTPAMKRITISVRASGASAQPRLPSTNSPSPTISGTRRPKRSDSGP